MSQQGESAGEADRVRELEAELAQLKGAQATQPIKTSHSKWRSFWSAVCIVVAVVLAPLSIVAVWARGEVTDTERFVSTVAPLAQDPAIQEAIGDRVADEVLAYIDIESLTQNAISAISDNRDLDKQQVAALETLSGPLTSGIEGFVRDRVQDFVRSEIFASVWNEITTRAHSRLNEALSGDQSGALSLQGSDVVLDLGQVVEQVKASLVEQGLTVVENIPAVDSEIVIFESDSLASLQRGYSAINNLGYWLPIIAGGLAILGVVIANIRRKAVLGLGIGVTISALASAILLSVGRAEYLNALPETVNIGAATAFFDTLTLYLEEAMRAALAAGIILILAALLVGPARFAVGRLAAGAASRRRGRLLRQDLRRTRKALRVAASQPARRRRATTLFPKGPASSGGSEGGDSGCIGGRGRWGASGGPITGVCGGHACGDSLDSPTATRRRSQAELCLGHAFSSRRASRRVARGGAIPAD